MTRRNLTTALLAAALATGVAVTMTAHPLGGDQGTGATQGGPGMRRGPGGPGPFGLPGLRQLDLSDAQREQIRTIHESHRDEARQIGERTREAQRALDLATETGTVDEGDLRDKATALGAAISDGAILRAKVNAEILNVLTAEQREKLNEFRATMQQRRQASQDRFKERVGRRQQRGF
jgi:protein CpxP